MTDLVEALEMHANGVKAIRGGDRASAAQWFQRAGEAGYAEAYGALTQLSVEAQDTAGEAHWAQRGAELGEPFCTARHGLLLLRSATGPADQTRAREFLERAATGGDVTSMVLAAHVNRELGDLARSRQFAAMAQQTSDSAAIDRLHRFGLA